MASIASRTLSAAVLFLLSAAPGWAESLTEAMAAAYANNPTLNAARAGVRATDEGVPQALSGYRPKINAFGTAGDSYSKAGGNVASITVGVSLVQPIFDGYQTVNSTKAAEAAVRAARENLRNTEQNVLLSAVTAYMDVIGYSAIVELRRSSVGFIAEQVRSTRLRLEAGETTATDVAQTEAALAAAQSLVSLAEANLASARATYVQVVGHEPKNLNGGKGAERLIPKSLDAAIGQSRAQHPAILAAVHNADVASFNAKVAEGALLPSLSLEASAQRQWYDGTGSEGVAGAQILGRLTIPLYQGGGEYSRVRQAKENLGQMKIAIDAARDQVRAALVGSWGMMEAARAQTVAARAQVAAAQLALNGVIEEQKVGQRTTLDVLNAQNTLVSAQLALVSAQHDGFIAGYSVLAATGGLSHEKLGLKVAAYDPAHHYEKVRDKWGGMRTPDGR